MTRGNSRVKFGLQSSETDASSDMMKYETQRWIYKYAHPICISWLSWLTY